MKLSNILKLKNTLIHSKKHPIIFCIITLITFIFYSSTLNNGYNLDDDIAFTANKHVLSGISNLKSIFTENTFEHFSLDYGYRPISTLSFAIEYILFGVNPFVSHLISILLYSSGTFLFFIWLKNLFPSMNIGVTATIVVLFLALPIHSEIVNNIKSRDELLMLNFGLLASYFSLKASEKHDAYLLLVFLFLLLSALSKKTGLIFLGIIPASLYFFKTKLNWKKLALITLPLISTFITIRLLKKGIMVESSDRIYNTIENPLYNSSFIVDQWSLSLHSFWFYIKKMAYPEELVSYYGFDTIQYQQQSIYSFSAFILIITLLVLGAYSLKKRLAVSFGAIVLIGGLLPFLNIQTPAVGIVAERFATLASIGYVIIIAFLILKASLWLSKKYQLAIIATILSLYLLTSYSAIQARNKEWRNKETLFSADVKKEPKSATLHALLARVYLEKDGITNEHRSIIQFHLEQSIAIFPDKYILTDLANLHSNINNNKIKGAKLYNKTIEIYPEFAEPHYHLGWNLLGQGDTLGAINSYRQAIKKDSTYELAYEPLIRSLLAIRNKHEANKICSLAEKRFPESITFSALCNTSE
jgi:tetratricopeptide (TPR) repeat protein